MNKFTEKMAASFTEMGWTMNAAKTEARREYPGTALYALVFVEGRWSVRVDENGFTTLYVSGREEHPMWAALMATFHTDAFYRMGIHAQRWTDLKQRLQALLEQDDLLLTDQERGDIGMIIQEIQKIL